MAHGQVPACGSRAAFGSGAGESIRRPELALPETRLFFTNSLPREAPSLCTFCTRPLVSVYFIKAEFIPAKQLKYSSVVLPPLRCPFPAHRPCVLAAGGCRASAPPARSRVGKALTGVSQRRRNSCHQRELPHAHGVSSPAISTSSKKRPLHMNGVRKMQSAQLAKHVTS